MFKLDDYESLYNLLYRYCDLLYDEERFDTLKLLLRVKDIVSCDIEMYDK